MAKKQVKKTTVTTIAVIPHAGFWEKFEAQTSWQLLIIILVPLLVYLKVVNFEFIDFDDKAIIINHYDIVGNIRNIGEAFKRDAFLSTQGDSFYRPIQSISFMLDALVSGQNPFMYHLSNLLIHLITCITLYYFLKQLNIRNIVAFVFTLIFSVHPLFASAVSWVPARGDLLIGLLGLLLFISFHKHILSGKKIYFILHAVFFAIAVFTKETTVVFPLLLLFYYLFVLDRPFRIKKLLPYLMAWGFALAIYFIFRHHVIKSDSNDLHESLMRVAAFFENLAVIPITISKFFIPYNLSTLPLFDGTATITGIMLIALCFYLTLRYTNRKNKIILLGLVWFCVFTLPGLLIRVTYAESKYFYLEHRTYLIMIGVLIMLASSIDNLLDEKRILPATFRGIAFIIIIVFGILAFMHSDDYKDSMAFFSRAVSFDNAGACILRGNLYSALHDSADAAADYDRAVELSPNYPDAYCCRGKFEGELLQHTAAEEDFTKAIDLDSGMADAWIQRSVQRKDLQDYTGAINDLNKAIKLDSTNPEIYYRFGGIFFQQKKYKEAYYNLTKAITMQPNLPDVYMNRGSLRYTMNDLRGAVADYKKAIALKQGFLAYYNLGILYNNLHQLDEAIVAFDSCINISPDFPAAYMGRGKALQLKNDTAEACKNWQQAQVLGYATAKDTLDKYCK